MSALPTGLLTKARRGDPDAQCRIAEKLMSTEKPSGYRRALRWLRLAAASGKAWAAYHIALIYDHGRGVRRNRHVAVTWYERAAKAGFDSAQLNLGIILANRPSRRRDLARAIRLYRQAAAQGTGTLLTILDSITARGVEYRAVMLPRYGGIR